MLYEDARRNVASLIGARDSREIIFTRNTTGRINLVDYSWGRANLQAGDVIILTEMEHHLQPGSMADACPGTPGTPGIYPCDR